MGSGMFHEVWPSAKKYRPRTSHHSARLLPVGSRTAEGLASAVRRPQGAQVQGGEVTVAILAQGTTSGDALCAALFCVSMLRIPRPPLQSQPEAWRAPARRSKEVP